MRKESYSVFKFFKQDGGNEGDGDSGEAVKFDDDALAALDATDDACDAIEYAAGNQRKAINACLAPHAKQQEE